MIKKEEYIPEETPNHSNHKFQEGNLSKLDVALNNPETYDITIFSKDQKRFTKNQEQFFFGKFTDSKNF